MKLILLFALLPVFVPTDAKADKDVKEALPSLIPLPQNLQWTNGYFPVGDCKYILIRDNSLQKEAEFLQTFLKENGVTASIINSVSGKNSFIELSLGKVEVPQLGDEAYTLSVGKNKVRLVANTAHGIFNGIQTFHQLMNNTKPVHSCEIKDWPAFEWRGYMVDVGRNFQSVDFIKRQIDLMA
ncbi:MAG: beta-N-acetylhexosaminidase, partial [Ginsengibacter sp.]